MQNHHRHSLSHLDNVHDVDGQFAVAATERHAKLAIMLEHGDLEARPRALADWLSRRRGRLAVRRGVARRCALVLGKLLNGRHVLAAH